MSRGADGGCLVRFCDDCCCGSSGKHPGVDHHALVARLQALEPEHRILGSRSCLGSCDLSNVVVVSPSAAGRAAGGRATWFGRVLSVPTAEAIVSWVRAGGPGPRPVPEVLSTHVFGPAALARDWWHEELRTLRQRPVEDLRS